MDTRATFNLDTEELRHALGKHFAPDIRQMFGDDKRTKYSWIEFTLDRTDPHLITHVSLVVSNKRPRGMKL